MHWSPTTPDRQYQNPFNQEKANPLGPVARAVAWLVLTHHKLPQNSASDFVVDFDYVEDILDYALTPAWNSPQILDANDEAENPRPKKWDEKALQDVWEFKGITPVVEPQVV